MRNLRFYSRAATLVAVLMVSLLAGCASKPEPQTETLSSETSRFLYPRQYHDSLDPLERRDVERQMDREQRMMEEEERKR